jgi:hypothetical protein
VLVPSCLTLPFSAYASHRVKLFLLTVQQQQQQQQQQQAKLFLLTVQQQQQQAKLCLLTVQQQQQQQGQLAAVLP